jgi:hypothetical protein
LIRPEADDARLLKVGRIASVCIGITVTALAVIFVNSQFGIFNLMQAFFTLFNIPVVVPIAFGLIFRTVPKWAAFGAIVWGLITGAAARYVIGWDIGPQVYLSLAMTLGIFTTSRWTGRLYAGNKPALVLLSVLITVAAGALFQLTASPPATVGQGWLVWGSAGILGLSLFGLAGLFARDGAEERMQILEFFRKLDTPVDVEKEVLGAGRRQITTLPLIGGTTIVMGLLMSIILLTDLGSTDRIIVGVMVGVMIAFGGVMVLLSRGGRPRR